MDGVPETLGNCLATQTLDIEVVGFSREDDEHDHSPVETSGLLNTIENINIVIVEFMLALHVLGYFVTRNYY